MKQYLDILKNILDNGEPKIQQRTGEKIEGTLAAPGAQFFSHNMADGFPLLTCRDMSKILPKAMVELEGFIKGITSKQWYKDRGCPYWNWWANPIKVNERFSHSFLGAR